MSLGPRLLAVLSALVVSGCALGYRVGGGLAVATTGDVSVHVRAGVFLGVAPGPRGAIEELIEVEAGASSAPSAVLAPVLGLGYAHEGGEGSLGLRVGLRSRIQIGLDDSGARTAIGPGLALGLSYGLEDDGDAHESVVVELAGYALALEAETEGSLLGRLEASLYYELRIIDPHPLAGLFHH